MKVMAIASTNPATGETVRSFEALTESQIDEKLGVAREEGSQRTGRRPQRNEDEREPADERRRVRECLASESIASRIRTLGAPDARTDELRQVDRRERQDARRHDRREALGKELRQRVHAS